MDVKSTLKTLCEAAGVSGDEFSASEAARTLLAPYCPDAGIDAFGNVVGFLGDRKNGKQTLMLEAHIDQIGLIVTHIDENGFIKTARCGGVDRRLLLAQTVTIHGKKAIKGVVSTLPPHLAKDDKKAPEIEDIAIDAGFAKAELEKIVSPGDKITIDGTFESLTENVVTAPAIDDRGGVTAVLYALDLLRGRETAYNLAVVFAVQEEVGNRGAIISAYNVNADLSISVDVSFAQTPGVPEEKSKKMGGGAMIGIAASLDRRLFMRLRSLAAEKGIPYQIEAMGSDSGTDADEIGVSRGGVRPALISVPLKYMHMPVETADINDIKAVGALIAEFMEKGAEDGK